MNKLTLLNFFTVLRCSGCDDIFKLGREGNGTLCEVCTSKFEEEKQRACVSCGLTAQLCRCVPENIRSSGCNTLLKIGFYDPDDEGVTERLILTQKDYKNQRTTRFIADQLTASLRACLINSQISISNVIITYAPRSRAAVNEKGFDQAENLAKLCAKRLGCQFLKLLARNSRGKQQKELDRAERSENAKRTYEMKQSDLLTKATVVIVDDIVTTGASLAACVDLLKKAGAENVICLVIAQTNSKTQNIHSKHKK